MVFTTNLDFKTFYRKCDKLLSKNFDFYHNYPVRMKKGAICLLENVSAYMDSRYFTEKGGTTMIYEVPNSTGTKVHFKDRYENYINGKWTAPAGGEYFENTSPVNGKVLCEVARSTKKMSNSL